MVQFIPGVQLNGRFYREAVAPIFAAALPELRYSAALIGYGSDVLGFDSERSTDHEWGPRLVIFLGDDDHRALANRLTELLAAELPTEFCGYSTNFSEPDENRVRWMVPGSQARCLSISERYISSRAATRLSSLIKSCRVSTGCSCIRARCWKLRVARFYHDGLHELVPLRQRLQWYPHEVWLFMLASQWIRVGQEEAFPSRCGEAGDELGSRINAARMVRDVMRLCLLMERRYAPYSKWLGTAFSRLNCAHELEPVLRGALVEETWQGRERYLCAAYEIVARMHNEMGLFAELKTSTMSFHERPYRVLGAGRFAKAVSDAIRDEQLRKIYATVGPIGSIDQFGDSTNLLKRSDLRARLRVLFESAAT